MAAWLCAMPDFPMNQPYNTYPWDYNGSELVTSVPNPDVVDWVLVELRDADIAANATSGTMIARQAGFLLTDGSVVCTDGNTSMFFSAAVNQNLFAVICHRNHLDVMSGNPLVQNGNIYTYDFTTAAGQAHGGILGHKEIDAGVYGMTGGDGMPDGQIGNGDKVDVWVPQSGSSGYLYGDFSLDGQVNNGDKVEVWGPNSGSGSQVPD